MRDTPLNLVIDRRRSSGYSAPRNDADEIDRKDACMTKINIQCVDDLAEPPEMDSLIGPHSYTPAQRKDIIRGLKLSYHFGGHEILCRRTSGNGLEVVAKDEELESEEAARIMTDSDVSIVAKTPRTWSETVKRAKENIAFAAAAR